MAFLYFTMNNQPIGIFDSGVGGVSVWKEIVKELPFENIIYYADSANCPYGSKSKEEIIQLSARIVDFLIQKKCKIIVVACNTATAAAIEYLRGKYSISFVGMEPAVKPASLNSKTKSIAVLATEGTFNGKLYKETSERFAKGVELNIKVGERLVDIVENNLVEHESTKAYLQELINPLLKKNIDYLVLGCTHYPFLIPVLNQILSKEIEIIDPAPAVAKQTCRILNDNQILNEEITTPKYEFYTSGDKNKLNSFLNQITDKSVIINEV